MKIEIFTDYTCPFCYIGKRQLELALEKTPLKEHPEIVYKNYEINPKLNNEEKFSYKEYMLQQMTEDKLQTFLEELTSHATDVGLTYDFDTMIPANTADAHRLGKWVATKGQENAYTEKLMIGYFTQGKDLANQHYLLEVIESLTLSLEDAKAVLDKKEYQYELDMDSYAAQQLGVESAPFFVFDNRFGIVGAEPEEVFIRTIKQSSGEF